jgi:hypothetical protein
MRPRPRIQPGAGDQKRKAHDEATDSAAPIKALAAWADSRAKELKVVAQRRDADGVMADRALEIVRKFIVERGLILFGGLAIDYALRLRGSSLYAEDERPDFDVLSPRSVDDAYDLADILQAAGFDKVGVVRGIHVQTMRVRTDFIWVADIGYAPPEVFDRIPTLELRGMRLVHPTFQRMDMHLAFCFPFNGPPHEDVFHRWRKDLDRFNRFEKFYPLETVPAAAASAATSATASAATSAATSVVTVQSAVALTCEPGKVCTVALHGFAAYALLREALEELAMCPAFEGLVSDRDAIPRLALVFPDDHSFEVEVPAGSPVAHLASSDPISVVGDRPSQWFEPYMDLCPESVQVGPLVIRSTKGRLLAASLVRARRRPRRADADAGADANADAGADADAGAELHISVNVVTPQYLLLHLLYEAHRADGTTREILLAYYQHTLAILRIAERAYAARMNERDPEICAAIASEFAASPFAPVVRTIGDVNTNAAYIIKMAGAAAKLRDTPPATLHLDPGIAGYLEGLPANYYPATSKARPTFDYSQSPLFRRSGERRP